MSISSFIVAILPVLLIGLYIYKKDNNKESYKLLFKLFIMGLLSCFPAIAIGSFMGNYFPPLEEMNFIQLLLYSFIVVALVEELCKWYFLYRVSYNHNEFDTLYDMVVYSSFIALGFACLENILYVSSFGISTGLFRAVVAVPSHVCCGIFMGSYLALSKMNEVGGNVYVAKKYKYLSMIIPILIHGIYDYCLFLGSTFFILLFYLFVIILFVLSLNKVKTISREDIKFK